MPGIMGRLMKWLKFTMNGQTKIYAAGGKSVQPALKEAKGHDIELSAKKEKETSSFMGMI